MVLPPCHHCNQSCVFSIIKYGWYSRMVQYDIPGNPKFEESLKKVQVLSFLWTNFNCKTHFLSAGTDFFEVFCARPNTFAIGFWYWRPNSCSPISFFRCFLLWCCTLDPIGQCEPGWWLGLLGCDTDCCCCHGRVTRWNGWRCFQASGHRPHDQWHTRPPLLRAPTFAWWWVA